MSKFCEECGRKVSDKNTSGRCKSCGVKASWKREDCRESHAQGYTEFLNSYYADPKLRELHSARCKSGWTDNTRVIVSKQAKERWEDPVYRTRQLKYLNKGIVDENHLASMAEKIWNNPEHNKKMLRAQATTRNDPAKKRAWDENLSKSAKRRWAERNNVENTERALRANAGKNVPNPSGLELKVAKVLDELGLSYIQQFRPKGYNRIYDFLLPDFGLLIEVDGDYWHSSNRAKAVDGEKDNWAYANNYSLVRLKEHDIKEFGALPLVETELSDYILL